MKVAHFALVMVAAVGAVAAWCDLRRVTLTNRGVGREIQRTADENGRIIRDLSERVKRLEQPAK